MKTPICDFVRGYVADNKIRMHMPGHKGIKFLGFEAYDITEINGADSLYEAHGIISQSESIASEIFGCPTFYSSEGSSQCIRAMLYLLCIAKSDTSRKTFVLAGRNAHKTFVSAAALLDIDVDWIFPTAEESYLSCNITADRLNVILEQYERKPDAVYITTPDYLGNIVDVKCISEVCHKHNVMLLVDNAHGAYLKFLSESRHPIDLGADMCCDSAHKTLPALTGAAYLHLSEGLPCFYHNTVKDAMAQFGSTSPSYLLLQSLDYLNSYLSANYKEKLYSYIKKVDDFKKQLTDYGYILLNNEKLKVTINAKAYGYYGYELAEVLYDKGVVCEYCDSDYLVMMLTPENADDTDKLRDILISIERREAIIDVAPQVCIPRRAVSVREACFSKDIEINVENASGRIISRSTVGCPPAVPIIVPGEIVSEETIECFRYYGIKTCKVID